MMDWEQIRLIEFSDPVVLSKTKATEILRKAKREGGRQKERELEAARDILRLFDEHVHVDHVPKTIWKKLQSFYAEFGPPNHEES